MINICTHAGRHVVTPTHMCFHKYMVTCVTRAINVYILNRWWRKVSVGSMMRCNVLNAYTQHQFNANMHMHCHTCTNLFPAIFCATSSLLQEQNSRMWSITFCPNNSGFTSYRVWWFACGCLSLFVKRETACPCVCACVFLGGKWLYDSV